MLLPELVAAKVATAVVAALALKLQPPVPVQGPLQPVNVEPLAGVAVRLTAVPEATLTVWVVVHVLPHASPVTLLVTLPDPVPCLDTDTLTEAFGLDKENWALTDRACVMLTEQVPDPLQAPLQPVKTEPLTGVAARVTVELAPRRALQALPQEIRDWSKLRPVWLASQLR
jgi:hypothetical protein